MQDNDRCQTSGRPYILARKTSEKNAIVFQPDCGQWDCPYCAEKRKNEWFLRAYKGVSEFTGSGHSVDFITLTARGGAKRSVSGALLAFKLGWPKLRKRVVYRQQKISYIMIPEQHQSGVMHCHVLATNEQSKKWWKDNAYKSGLGYQVKVKPVIDPGQGAFYVCKYIGKDFVSVTWPKGFRRVRVSQDWPRLELPEGESPFDYEVYKNFGDCMWNVALLRDAGVVVDFALSPDHNS